jgi:hypothetical protein
MSLKTSVLPALLEEDLAFSDWRYYISMAVFVLANIALPQALHQIPRGGQIFLPIFFFTLIATWQFGPALGVGVALLSPLCSHLLTGMPVAAILPLVLAKSLGLTVSAALLRRLFPKAPLLGFMLAVAGMQSLGFLLESLAGFPLASSLDALHTAIPGMLIMVLGGYPACLLINRILRHEP